MDERQEALRRNALLIWGMVAVMLLVAVVGVGLTSKQHNDELTADEALKKQVEEKIACGPAKDIVKGLTGRQFYHLLTAHPIENHKITQQIWASGTEITATLLHEDYPEKMCLFNRYNDVTYNPITIKSIGRHINISIRVRTRPRRKQLYDITIRNTYQGRVREPSNS